LSQWDCELNIEFRIIRTLWPSGHRFSPGIPDIDAFWINPRARPRGPEAVFSRGGGGGSERPVDQQPRPEPPPPALPRWHHRLCPGRTPGGRLRSGVRAGEGDGGSRSRGLSVDLSRHAALDRPDQKTMQKLHRSLSWGWRTHGVCGWAAVERCKVASTGDSVWPMGVSRLVGRVLGCCISRLLTTPHASGAP